MENVYSYAQFAIHNHTKTDDEMITLAHKSGDCLAFDGRNYEAQKMYQMVLEHREKVLGPEHPETFTTINNLGSDLDSQGKYEEAEAMYQQALKNNLWLVLPCQILTMFSTYISLKL